MKIKKIAAITICLIIITIVFCTTMVSASPFVVTTDPTTDTTAEFTEASTSSFKFTAEAQKEIFKPGEEVVISLDIDEINAGIEGINVVEMSLEYEKDVFESIEFIKENNWDSTYNNNENSEKFGKLLYTNISTGVTQAETIGNIKLKLKDNLSDMETEIKLLSVTSNDGKTLMPEGDRIIKIKIVSEKPVDPEEPAEPEEPVEPEKPAEPEKPESPKEEVNIMPQTGQTRIIYIVLGIVIFCALIALVIGVALSKRSEASADKKEINQEKNKDNNNNND